MTESDLLNRLEHINTNYDLFELLKETPPDNWIKQHPEIATYRYLPIDKAEFLLRAIFGFNYRIEVLDTKELFNATSVMVRVHFREKDSPFNWYYHDGVGADAPKKKDSEFIDYSVAASLPIAKSNAIKDACDHFGILFGSDLNRIDTISKDSKMNDTQKLAKIKKLFSEFEDKIPSKDFPHFQRIIETEEKNSYNKLLLELETIKNK
jgi:hypothetical protein